MRRHGEQRLQGAEVQGAEVQGAGWARGGKGFVSGGKGFVSGGKGFVSGDARRLVGAQPCSAALLCSPEGRALAGGEGASGPGVAGSGKASPARLRPSCAAEARPS